MRWLKNITLPAHTPCTWTELGYKLQFQLTCCCYLFTRQARSARWNSVGTTFGSSPYLCPRAECVFAGDLWTVPYLSTRRVRVRRRPLDRSLSVHAPSAWSAARPLEFGRRPSTAPYLSARRRPLTVSLSVHAPSA